MKSIVFKPVSWYMKQTFFDNLEWALQQAKDKVSHEQLQTLQDKRKEIADWIAGKRFKEHFMVLAFTQESDDAPYIIAIDQHFEDVSIMRNAQERNMFRFSLGPEYDHAERAQRGFAQECLALVNKSIAE